MVGGLTICSFHCPTLRYEQVTQFNCLNRFRTAPASFQDRYQLIKARRNEQIELRCECNGELPLRIIWSKDGRSLPVNTSNGELTGDLSNTGGAQLVEQLNDQKLSSRLQLPPLNKYHSGLYM